MDILFNFLTRAATGRNVLMLLVLYLFFVAYALPHAAATLQQDSGQPDFEPLDLRFGFSPEEAWQALEALGPVGREHYRSAETIMDVFYPLTYGLFFSLLMLFLFQKAGGRLARMRWLAVLPLVGTLFDWLENFGIVRLIDVFPARADGWAQFAAAVGEIKWLFAFIGIVGSLTGLVGWMMARWKARSGNAG
ncbi:MAG: hypothetical protein H7246_05730 [Phycisphaerae bacterium]|nr:hypothetical protein [Saprospiraceae bacterium]